MNDRICPDLTSVVYTSVDNAVEIIRNLGPGTELVKMDLSGPTIGSSSSWDPVVWGYFC